MNKGTKTSPAETIRQAEPNCRKDTLLKQASLGGHWGRIKLQDASATWNLYYHAASNKDSLPNGVRSGLPVPKQQRLAKLLALPKQLLVLWWAEFGSSPKAD
jgi:hypothetical protein